MFDSHEFDRWWSMATDARQAAATQADHDSRHWACFLAEQGGQFAVKALLHGLGTGAWGHDLVQLGRTVEETVEEPLPEPVGDALVRLSRHYIATRYPDAHPAGTPREHYTARDVERALEDLEAVLDFVRATWDEAGGTVQEEH